MLREKLADMDRLLASVRVQMQAFQHFDTEPGERDEEVEKILDEATVQYGAAMQEHLELATQCGEEWFDAVLSEISRCGR